MTELDDATLMALFGEMTEWVNHYAGRLARARQEELFAEAVLDLRRAHAVVAKATKSVTEAKAAADANPEVDEAKTAYLQAKSARITEETGYGNADRLHFFLSRELTRRTSRSDREMRGRNWTP
ncbi:hypothetical protein ACWDTT_36285 [Streptosporangium sandarakinum]